MAMFPSSKIGGGKTTLIKKFDTGATMNNVSIDNISKYDTLLWCIADKE